MMAYAIESIASMHLGIPIFVGLCIYIAFKMSLDSYSDHFSLHNALWIPVFGYEERNCDSFIYFNSTSANILHDSS